MRMQCLSRLQRSYFPCPSPQTLKTASTVLKISAVVILIFAISFKNPYLGALAVGIAILALMVHVMSCAKGLETDKKSDKSKSDSQVQKTPLKLPIPRSFSSPSLSGIRLLGTPETSEKPLVKGIVEKDNSQKSTPVSSSYSSASDSSQCSTSLIKTVNISTRFFSNLKKPLLPADIIEQFDQRRLVVQGEKNIHRPFQLKNDQRPNDDLALIPKFTISTTTLQNKISHLNRTNIDLKQTQPKCRPSPFRVTPSPTSSNNDNWGSGSSQGNKASPQSPLSPKNLIFAFNRSSKQT